MPDIGAAKMVLVLEFAAASALPMVPIAADLSSWLRADLVLAPLFEKNQGLLSLVALVSALAFALHENHRVNGEADRRLAEYTQVICEVSDEFAFLCQSFEEALEDYGIAIVRFDDWNRDRALLRKTLDYLRQSCPPVGRLVILLTELDNVFGAQLSASTGDVSLIEDLAGLRTEAARLRQEIEAVR